VHDGAHGVGQIAILQLPLDAQIFNAISRRCYFTHGYPWYILRGNNGAKGHPCGPELAGKTTALCLIFRRVILFKMTCKIDFAACVHTPRFDKNSAPTTLGECLLIFHLLPPFCSIWTARFTMKITACRGRWNWC